MRRRTRITSFTEEKGRGDEEENEQGEKMKKKKFY